MADKDTATPTQTRRRVGDYNPDTETGDLLDTIANTDVTIASVQFDERNGRNGKYVLSVITLDNGNVYHTGSPVVAERLAAVYGVTIEELREMIARNQQPAPPTDALPIVARFSKTQSQNDRSRSYWTVE